MEHEQGKCPACGSDGLTYGDTKKQDVALGYEYTCDDCGFIGIEWYNLHFTEHTDPDGNTVRVGDGESNDQKLEQPIKAVGQPIIDVIEEALVEEKLSANIIIFMVGGVLNSVSSTDPNIKVALADKDCIETDEDEAAYSLLVSLSESEGYTDIY